MPDCNHVARVGIRVSLGEPALTIECALCEIQRLESALELVLKKAEALAGALPPPGSMAELNGVKLLPPWDEPLRDTINMRSIVSPTKER